MASDDFAHSRGNDLITAALAFGSPDRNPATAGVCAPPPGREAVEAEVARAEVLAARNKETLAVIPLDVLKQYALDLQ
jgi:uncharacterized protein (DUF2237 family)